MSALLNEFRPDLDRFLRVSEVLGDDLHPKVREPVLRAEARGVIGWCVGNKGEEVCELYADRVAPMNVHDLPVPVAAEAFVRDWLPWESLHQVLQARSQVMGPGDEGVYSDDDGHWDAHCYCGWSETFLSEGDAEHELDVHVSGHLF